MPVFVFLALILAVLSAAPAQAYSPAPAQPCIGGAQFIGNSPNRLSIKCVPSVTGYADALKGALHYSANSTGFSSMPFTPCT